MGATSACNLVYTVLFKSLIQLEALGCLSMTFICFIHLVSVFFCICICSMVLVIVAAVMVVVLPLCVHVIFL